MSSPRILLTNDDGIDAPGIAVMAEALEEIGDVLVVAPATEQSAMGRSLSYGRSAASYTEDVELNYTEDEEGHSYEIPASSDQFGYALSGSPCDCVIAGLNAFEPRPDIVVSGCNDGPNLGASVLTRSGTVSAAIEAAYNGVPGVAVSTESATGREDFDAAAAFAAQFVERIYENGTGRPDYFNVNVPSDGGPKATRTQPCPLYRMDADRNGNGIRVTTAMFKRDSKVAETTPENTDRAAFLRRGETSISPLALPATPVEIDGLETALPNISAEP